MIQFEIRIAEATVDAETCVNVGSYATSAKKTPRMALGNREKR
jgi:hypothetical protein